MQGNSTKEICRALNLAEGTIKVHTTAILRALNAASRTQAICALTRLGISLSSLVSMRPARSLPLSRPARASDAPGPPLRYMASVFAMR